MHDIDEKDEEILKALRENSRMSFRDLGERLGVSDVTVKNRIDKLRDAGVIERFTVDVNPNELGKQLLVTIGVKVDPRMIDETLERLVEIEEFYSIWNTTGAHNLSIRAAFRDTDHMNSVLDTTLNVYGIREYHLSILSEEVKDSPIYP